MERNEITPSALFDRVVLDLERPAILDVRNEDEARRFPLEGKDGPLATLNIPYFEYIDDPDAAIAKVPADGRERIVVCAKGDSSAFVAELLRDAGRRATNLAGGAVAWGDLHVPRRIRAEERFEIWQVVRWAKGCLSYVVIAGGEAAVIDASRHVSEYERLAAERGARIVRVLDTHVHADHLSGSAALARTSGATRILPGAPSGAGTFRLGGAAGVPIETRVLETPGHTPSSTSYLIAGRWLISGDTLFVSGIGRPDLGGHAEEWGRMLFRTLHGPIAALPGDTIVLPAHFSSGAEAGPDGTVRTELREALARSPELAIPDEEGFVRSIAAAVKPAPEVYARIIQANLEDRAVAPEIATEWELGKNQCAASLAKSAAAQEGAGR